MNTESETCMYCETQERPSKEKAQISNYTPNKIIQIIS